MSLKVFLIEEYDHTHEREQFRNLTNLLKGVYDNTPEMNLLFANVNFNGIPLDALFIKPDAIIVLEFKNYTGNVVAAENGDWKLDDQTIIKGGMGKNPFIQTRNNKFAVVSTLDTWFPRSYVNLGHVSGIVVFNQPVEINNLISDRSKSWFHICDMNQIIDKVRDITSLSIRYTEQDLDELPKVLNCADSLIYQSPLNRPIQQPVVSPINAQQPTNSLSNRIRNILTDSGYNIVHEINKQGKEASYDECQGDFGERVDEYVRTNYGGRLYKHQYSAVRLLSEGRNVCIATSTSSGKTAVFHIAALKILEQNPDAKILAIYPMKALGKQQVESWETKLKDVEGVKCGRIDGNVKDPKKRKKILSECNVVTFTPDTVHTFLLGKLKDSIYSEILKEFISNLRLVIIDEVHLYRGMFGSNSAYLFRRLNSCVLLANGGRHLPQYITASATINDPVQHSMNISGVDGFEIVGPDMDTSPSCPTKIFFVEKGNRLSDLLGQIAKKLPEEKTITFIDSRKTVTEVAANTAATITDEDCQDLDMLEIGIYPFKSGMEDEDFTRISNALGNGNFRGVVSTSSLEVGIDINNLNIAILEGIPNSSTSLYQRIGRVGRDTNSQEAVVIIINNPKSIVTQKLFRSPQKLLSLPPEEPALYLENKNLINIQALHFVGYGDEFQSVADKESKATYSKIERFFPQEFNTICRDVLIRQYSADYQDYMDKGGNYPESVFTLRQFGIQYNVYEHGIKTQGWGVLSMQNVLREAYPGAIYRYINVPKRVIKVDNFNHEIILSPKWIKNNVSTKPITTVAVTPQKNSTNNNLCFGERLYIINLGLIEFTQIKGYKRYTHNGGHTTEERIDYPSRADGWTQNSFKHTLNTVGVIICHPLIKTCSQRKLVAKLLYESFLSNSAFERSDIEYGAGMLNTDIGDVKCNTQFITIYDKVDGGLNITSKLMNPDELKKGFAMMIDIIDSGIEPDILGVPLNQDTKDAIHEMYNDIIKNVPTTTNSIVSSEYHIAKKSEALYLPDPNDPNTHIHVVVDMVYLNNILNEITYDLIADDGTMLDDIPECQVIPIPGCSYKGTFVGVRPIKTEILW